MILDELMLNKAKVKTEETIKLLEQSKSETQNNEVFDKAISVQKELAKDLDTYLNNETYCKIRNLEEKSGFALDVHARICDRYKGIEYAMLEEEWLDHEEDMYIIGKVLADKNHEGLFLRTKPISDYINILGDIDKDKATLKEYMDSTEFQSQHEIVFMETLDYLGEDSFNTKEGEQV